MTRKWSWFLWGISGVLVITVPAAIMSQRDTSEEEWNLYIPELVVAKDIKNHYKNTECLKSYFEEVDWEKAETNTEGDPTIPDFSEDSLQSCLSVSHQKQKYKNKKWTGRFKLVWSVSDDKNGLITTIKSETKEGKLKVSYVAYLTEKKNDKWEISHTKENGEEEIKDETDKFKKIPQMGGGMGEHGKFMAFWGFNPILNKICQQDECKNSEEEIVTSSTTWIFSRQNEEGKLNVTSWSSALNTWLEDTFGWNKLYEQLEKIKGSWLVKSNS